jgi:hypothetical protein
VKIWKVLRGFLEDSQDIRTNLIISRSCRILTAKGKDHLPPLGKTNREGRRVYPTKSPATRQPGARLSWREGKGVDGNQVGVLADVEDDREQLKSGDGREVAVGRLG